MSASEGAVWAGWTASPWTHEGITRDVLVRGEGPAVVIMPEIPGPTPEVAAFAERVVARGYTVFVPVLFGVPGRRRSAVSTAAALGEVCVSRLFGLLRADASAPVVDWLRSLAREAHARAGGPGVGVVGMCITGGFALSVALEPAVKVPILSQPSHPFGVTPRLSSALGMTDAAWASVRHRVAEERLTVFAARFSHDALCPRARFERLRAELGPAFEGVEVDSGPGNPWGHRRWHHSVLTNDLLDEEGQPTRAVLERVLGLFDERLKAEATGG